MSRIGYSGLSAAQIAMNVTAQNIANINTPGFSRLSAVQESVGGAGKLGIGGGVNVSYIRRISDDFNNQQLWRATTNVHFFGSGQDYLGSLEEVMSGEGSSISLGLDNFFASLSEASATPDSIPLRQQVLSEMRNLTQRFNGLNSNLNNQLSALHEQRQSMSSEINGLTDNLALLNKKIVEAEASGADSSSLRDHREALVAELSKYADLRTNEMGDGSLSISLANGQPLVAGSTAGKLQITVNAAGEQEVALDFAGNTFPLKQDNFGGAFGGLYEVEHEHLLPAREALSEMAGEMTSMINDTLASGFDLNGNPGKPLLSFNPDSANGMLEFAELEPEELAFSQSPDEPGDNTVLLALIELKNKTINVGGSEITLNDAYSGLLGEVGSASRQNQADLETAVAVAEQAQAQRDSVSGVSENEEAINLMEYTKAYQANMKVIETANQLFDAMLAAF